MSLLRKLRKARARTMGDLGLYPKALPVKRIGRKRLRGMPLLMANADYLLACAEAVEVGMRALYAPTPKWFFHGAAVVSRRAGMSYAGAMRFLGREP